MKTEANDPAFAGNEYDHGQYNPGLTKREFFAIQFASAYMGAGYIGNSGVSPEEITERGVSAADALIKELNNTSTEN